MDLVFSFWIKLSRIFCKLFRKGNKTESIASKNECDSSFDSDEQLLFALMEGDDEYERVCSFWRIIGQTSFSSHSLFHIVGDAIIQYPSLMGELQHIDSNVRIDIFMPIFTGKDLRKFKIVMTILSGVWRLAPSFSHYPMEQFYWQIWDKLAEIGASETFMEHLCELSPSLRSAIQDTDVDIPIITSE